MKFKTISKLGKIFAILMVAIMAFTFLPGESFAATGKVHVIVENTTFTKATTESDGNAPAWSGTLVDTYVDLKDDSTMMSLIVEALSDYEVVGAESNYISEINGLAQFNAGTDSGWMGTLNDWFVHEGFQNFTVEENELKNDDEIRVMYTCNLGVDLGSEESNTDKSLKSVTFNSGKLDKTFAKGTYEYTLKLLNGTTSVKVTPTALNKNYQVKTYVGETEYKRTQDIPVSEGTVITVKCGDKSWPSMSDNTAEGTTYTFTVAFEEEKDVASGKAGNVNWVLKYDGTLIISPIEGTDGKMTGSPWRTSYKNEIKKVVIEDGVKSISNMAFMQCMNITSAEIPTSVEEIGSRAFYACQKMTSVSLPCPVGTMAFMNCKALETVNISGTFNAGGNTFTGCTALKNLNIASNFNADIDFGTIFTANYQTSNDIDLRLQLKKITTEEGGAYSMKGDLLCKGTKVVFAPYAEGELQIPEGITEIGERAFKKQYHITGVKFPSTLKKIGANAFDTSKIRGSVVIPKSVNNLGDKCFSACKMIQSVTFEPGSTEELTLGEETFGGCSALKTVDLPENVTKLNSMLTGCTGLETLDTKNVTELGQFDMFTVVGIKEMYVGKCLTKMECDWAGGVHPEVIYYEGSKEDWDKISFHKTVTQNIEEFKIAIVYNYKGTFEGKAPVIKNTFEDQTVGQYLRAKAYTVDVDLKDDERLVVYWYVNDGFAGISSALSIDTSVTGTYKVQAKAVLIKGEESGVAYSNIATVTVNELDPGELLVGKGTEEEPYLLRNAEDMNNLSSLVQYISSFEGKYFTMTDDIELPEGWKPIGTTKDGSNDIKKGANLAAFSGIIDGDNHRLTVPKGGLPLLGYIKGAEVKNLRIYGEQIDGYGLVNNFEGVGLSGSAIVIDNVTIESGTKILKSGLLGGNLTTNVYAGNSAAFVATVKNCTIEEGAIIGYKGDQELIGGFAGRMQGTIENCVNNGTVKGTNYVGGIIGTRDNAMGGCVVENCTFHGKVVASGKYAGGIAGGGYANSSAPNGIKMYIADCYSDGIIEGDTAVGGIFGGDEFVLQAWNDYKLKGNTFAGTVKGNKYVGGIIGHYQSLNKHDLIYDNTYTLDCGADNWIGGITYIDTNCTNPKTVEGTTYVNSEGKGDKGLTDIHKNMSNSDENRTDDPLGADSDKLAKAVKSDKMLAGEVDKLIENIDMTSSDRAVKVAEARTAYNALTNAQKALVTKLETLEGYEAQLTDEEKAEAVDELIDEIGTPVTLGSKKAVRKARKAYDDLTPAQKNLVENYAALERAERELSPLLIQQAEDLINALPEKDEITLNDKEAIEEARAAYDELTEDEKKEISKDTLKKLTDAEKAYEKLVPKTGDSNNVIVYSAVLMLSVLALMGTVVYKKRKSMQ